MGQLSPDTLKSVLSSKVFGRVYAFDPGDSTGICILDQSAPGIYHVRTVVQQDLFRLLSRYDTTVPSMIFYESFVSRPVQFARTQLAPQNIGAIQYWAYINDFKTMEIMPAETHRIKREVIRDAGWEWHTEHELDAIRIMVYGMVVLQYRTGKK